MVRAGRTRLRRPQPVNSLYAGCEMFEAPFELGDPGLFRLLALPGWRRGLRGAWLPETVASSDVLVVIPRIAEGVAGQRVADGPDPADTRRN